MKFGISPPSTSATKGLMSTVTTSIVKLILLVSCLAGSYAVSRFTLSCGGKNLLLLNGYHVAILLSTSISANQRRLLALGFLGTLFAGLYNPFSEIFIRFEISVTHLCEAVAISLLVLYMDTRWWVYKTRVMSVNYVVATFGTTLCTSLARTFILRNEPYESTWMSLWFTEWSFSIVGNILPTPLLLGIFAAIFENHTVPEVKGKVLKYATVVYIPLLIAGTTILIVWVLKLALTSPMIPTAILTLLAALVGVFTHGLETASFVSLTSLLANFAFNQPLIVNDYQQVIHTHTISQLLAFTISAVVTLDTSAATKLKTAVAQTSLESQKREQDTEYRMIHHLATLCEKMKRGLERAGEPLLESKCSKSSAPKSTNSSIETTESLLKDQVELLSLLDDMTYFSAAENGQIELQPRPVWLKDLVYRTISAARGLMDQRGDDSTYRFQSQVNVAKVFACFDSEAFQRVVIGTTLFAFPASYVSLEVTTTKIEEPSPPDLFPLTLEISVTHSGFQINAEDVNLLFRPCLAFCKDSKSSNLTGLEMSIVKSMVNLMGGSITAAWNEGAAHGGYCEIKISIPIIGSRASDAMHDFSITKEVSTSMLDFPIRLESNEYLSSLTERIRLMKFPHLLSNSCASSFKFDIRAGRDVATELASNTGSTSSEVAVDIEPPSILNFSPLQSKRKLLIADTSKEFRLEFKKMIENLTTDYVVFEASSCDEVILIMETDRIDIVFIELEMAKVKEYAQRRKFQQNSVSVIGMGTQSISAIQKNRLKALGLNYIIAKPISKGILLSLLKTFNTSRNVQFQKTQSLSDLENNYGESAYAKYSPTSPYSNAEVSFSPAESVSSEFSYRSTPIICRQRCDSLDSMSPQSINVHIFPQQQALDTNRLLALVVESSSPHRHTLVKILQNLGIFQDIFESSNELDAARLCSARKFSMIFIGVYPEMTEINDMIRRSRIEDIPVVVLMDSEQLCMPNPLDSSATLYRPVSSEEMESVIRKLLPESKLDWVRDSETIVAEGGKRKESVATLVGLHL